MLYTYYKAFGNNVLVRYKDGHNTISKTFKGYKPKLYIKSDEEQETKTIFGDNAKAIEFDCIKSAKNFAKESGSYEGSEIHGNQNFGNQFILDLMEGKSPIYDPTQFRGGVIDIEVKAPSMPKATDPRWPITAITIYDTLEEQYRVFLLKNEEKTWYKKNSSLLYINDINIEFSDYEEEKDLLLDFISFFKSRAFDFISGWNSKGFDTPYTVKRIQYLIGDVAAKQLSPFNMIYEREGEDKFYNKVLEVSIEGIPDLDFMLLYKKHIPTPRLDYKLDTIGEAEGVGKKLSFEESNNLYNLYDDDIQKYCDYNIQDVKIIVDLNKKLGLFELTLTLAYLTLSNFEDTLGTVKLWEQLMAKFLYNKNIVPPNRVSHYGSKDFDGAYVHPVVPGKHDSMFSVDLNSLYIHLMQQLNLGQETYIEHRDLPKEVFDKIVAPNYSFDDLIANKVDTSVLKKYNISMSPSFSFYSRDNMSIISEITRELYSLRKVHKKLMIKAEQDLELDKIKIKETGLTPELKQEKISLLKTISIEHNTQYALKILMNSGYGAIGNNTYLYYKRENAEAITTLGKFVNIYTSSAIEKFTKKLLKTDNPVWIAGDTDSAYFSVDPLIKQMNLNWVDDKDKCVAIIDKFHKTVIAPKIEKLSIEIKDYLNNYEQRMFWEREVIAESAIFVAKKNYAMKVWNSEGVEFSEPKYKYTGLSAVKSSTPPWAQPMLKECYKIGLNGVENDLIKYFKQCKSEFRDMNSTIISIPTGVNGLEKYYDQNNIYKKGAQAHVKAALFHNELLKRLEIEKITPILSGSKIRYLYLTLPNPYKFAVIGFEGGLPPEFELEEYIDREQVFEKGFLNHLTLFLEPLKWSHKKRIKLNLG